MGSLSATYILQVNPPYLTSVNAEEALYDSYQNALLLANALGLSTVAFPLLSAGAFGTGNPTSDKALSEAIAQQVAATTPTRHVQSILLVRYTPTTSQLPIGQVTLPDIAPTNIGDALEAVEERLVEENSAFEEPDRQEGTARATHKAP